MDDSRILKDISELVASERDLRDRLARGELTPAEEQSRLRAVEVELDRCWDLLRQRQAKREAGQDPAEAAERPAAEVEGYKQ
jgi:hypothetical protein